MRGTWGRRWLGAGVAVCGVLWASSARADQIVVLDQTWVHTPELPDSHFRVPPVEGTPGDWVNPADYSGGSAWVYLEVHTKPTDQETKFQVCFEATPTYACTAQSPTYADVGTYEWETPFSGFWSPPGTSVDWTQGVNQIACILKDTANGKPSADNVGAEIAALYTPTEVRMVVTIVQPGSIYVPPIPTGEGGTGTGGGTDTGGSDEGVDPDPASTGTVDGGGVPGTTDGGGGDEGSTSDVGAPVDGATSVNESSSGGSVPAASNGDSDDGCACTTAPRESWGLAWLLVIGLLRRRRGA